MSRGISLRIAHYVYNGKQVRILLLTPLGKVAIYYDNIEVVPTIEKIEDGRFSDVITYHLKYNYISDNIGHTLQCKLQNSSLDGNGESGERLESIAFESSNPLVRLSIGIDGEFLPYIYINEKLQPEWNYDWKYQGLVLKDGLEINIQNTDTSREYVFSVAWMFDYNDDTAYKTWLMADPTYI